MLFILTGDIQIGKTRWLSSLEGDLARAGVSCAGVIAPGVWVPSEHGDANGYEKLGIDNLLLPEGKRIAFARRRDLALVEGTLDPQSQSARMQLGWEISDAAIAQVNAHFDRIAQQAARTSGTAPARDAEPACRPASAPETASAQAGGLLIVDEFGRLELMRDMGLTSALALVDAGPTPAFPHALVVVRETLLDLARKRFSPAWENVRPIGPTPEAHTAVFAAFGLEG